jgi:pyridoxal phosphate enzyme (YggS family)
VTAPSFAGAPSGVAERLEAVRDRIRRAGGDPGTIRIVAVTKGFSERIVAEALAVGLVDVGENYAQELLSKADASDPRARWHFLGPVQRNKVRRLAERVTVWHGVDRTAAAEAIATAGPGSEIMVQVNVAGIGSKSGCAPADLEGIVERCRKLPVDLSGLMTVGPAGDLDESRRCFRWLANRASELGLRELSMGMSDDLEVAVEEGATTLRLGRVLFGPRPEREAVQR